MNEINSINTGSDISMQMLKSALDQSANLAEDLIKLNVENMIDINQLEYMGNVIDMYA